MSEKVVVAHWDRIAAHVRTVAQKAFMRGFSEGCADVGEPINRAAQQREALHYTNSGFEAETVREFFPTLGFTREDVRCVRRAAWIVELEPTGKGEARERTGASAAMALTSLADRIEALLPPEEK